MKTPQEIEQLNKKIAAGNETDKMAIVLLALFFGMLVFVMLVLWGLVHHTINTVIIVGVLILLVKIISK